MHELGATLCRVAKFLGRERPNASAAAVSRFEDGHPLAGTGKFTGCHQPRGARADHDKMLQMLKGGVHHEVMAELGAWRVSEPECLRRPPPFEPRDAPACVGDEP